MTHGTVECSECGISIDTTADMQGSPAPCPNCSSTKRKVQLFATGGQLSNYTRDNFVAHRLSLLTECGAKELPTNENWLNVFILNNIFRFRLSAEKRAYIFNFLRRTYGAWSAYREARLALIEYLNTPSNVVSPYFLALLNFELCISQCYQGYELLARASGEKFYEPNDKSEAERLQIL